MNDAELIKQPAALVIAHPGHELRVHGWLERARPVTFVLTNGDGTSGISRLDSTRSVLRAAGAQPGPVFGRFDDRDVYDALLRCDSRVFTDLAGEIANAFVSFGVRYVAVDAAEGYNPSHDTCRYVAAAAAALASRYRHPVKIFDFPLIAAPDACEPQKRSGAVQLQLHDDALERKIRAAHAYDEMKEEVHRALTTYGVEAFRRECLRPANPVEPPPDEPFYERYGRQQVAAGKYREAIRFDPHVRSVRDALLNLMPA